ncbi:MAG: MarR family transcriptional regulator [Proteobacteria bacterium]|nr:MarR family transcriptional regulator [Pseudomonadota bacterium]
MDAVRYVLGAIDLDPASCRAANQIVCATRYYDLVSDGLTQPWSGRILLNPPGDTQGKNVPAFWRKANLHVLAGDAVILWVGFTLEQLRTLQRCADIGGRPCPSPLHYPMVIPTERIAFIPGGEVTLQLGLPSLSLGDTAHAQGTGGHPTHSNFLCLLGGNRRTRERFVRRFSEFGEVIMPVRRTMKTHALARQVQKALTAHGSCNLAELARRLRRHRSIVREVVDAMLARGLVVEQNAVIRLSNGDV